MTQNLEKILVRVPASTSNLGPGFDCLGLALQLFNSVEIAWGEVSSPDPFFQEAAGVFFAKVGMEPRSFQCKITGDVPRSRGLGSSVTVRLGLIHGLNQLLGAPLSSETIFSLCAQLEGHPDNAAPAAFGGFTICRADGSWQRYEVDARLQFVLLIPDLEVATETARRAVPREFTREDAIWNLSHTAALAAAIASGRYELLEGTFSDRFHQPYRGRFMPFLQPVIAAGVGAGALGGWLSGSGSTIACATLQNAQEIAHAMSDTLKKEGFALGETRILTADNAGVQIVKI